MNPERLVIKGDFSHTDMYALLREALRLSIPKVCLTGDMTPLFSIAHGKIIRLRRLIIASQVLGQNAKEHDENGGQWTRLCEFLSVFHTVSLFYQDQVFSFPCFGFPKTNLK